MFLKRLLALTTKSETLVHTTSAYKMYDTTFEDKKATKLVLAHSTAPYAFLKRIKHDTIMSLYKLNAEKRTVTTQRMLPFEFVLRRETREFNKYILLKIAQALEFLHGSCEIVHGNIVKEALFFREDGGVLLGGFERSRTGRLFDEDAMMFSNLINELLGMNTTPTHFIENNGFCSELFFDLEIAFFGYRSFTAEQKLAFIAKAGENRHEFIDIHKRRMAWMVLADLNSDVPREFKVAVVDFILDLGVDMEEFLSPLFSVLDTNVRLHLLRSSKRYTGGIQSLDPVVKSLSLGIKCKDKQLRETTIAFVAENMSLISRKQQAEVLDVMYGYVSDDSGVSQVLDFLCRTEPAVDTDVVYRILCKYLLQSRAKLQVLNALDVFYESFDSFKMTTELLPLLCGCLSDKHIQMTAFSLIEKILQHLKRHKAEIVDSEWRLGGIKSLFKPKALQSETSATQKPSDVHEKQEPSEEWDSKW